MDIAPLFADDGVIAGPSEDTLRALRHRKQVMPLVGLRFSRLQVANAAFGLQPVEEFAAFVAEGCTPILDGNLDILKSPIGSEEGRIR